jgi:hypothetical protein
MRPVGPPWSAHCVMLLGGVATLMSAGPAVMLRQLLKLPRSGFATRRPLLRLSAS